MTTIRDACPIWITSFEKDVDHAVWDDVFGRMVASRDWHGSFPTVCGSDVVPAAMVAPPEPPCARCVAVLRARASIRSLPERIGKHHRHRRPGRIARLLRRRSCAATNIPPAGKARR